MRIVMKKILVLTMVLALLVAPMSSAFADAHGHENMIGLRSTIETLGGEIDWIREEAMIVFEIENGQYTYGTRTGVMTRNGIEIPNVKPLHIENGVTYVDQEFLRDVLAINDVASAFPTSLETAGLTPEFEALRAQLKAYMVFEHIHNLFDGQVLIAVGDDVLVHQAYGKANLVDGRNATILDTYSIGSTTKQMTAFAIMVLESEGLLSFDDTIDQYLENAPYGDLVTIDQLLTHTSGLPEYTDALLSGEAINDYDDVVAYVSNLPMNFDPGTDWLYNNTGYYLLGEIVEAVSEMPLLAFFNEVAFEPLEMMHTGWAFEEGVFKTTTFGSMQGEVESTHMVDGWLLSMAGGAGSIISTVDDLYRWQKGLYGGVLLDEEALEIMTGRGNEALLNPYYGYGLINIEGPYGYEFGHGGNTLGFTSSANYLELLDVHVLILSNKGYVDLNSIKENIYKILTGQEVSLVPSEVVELSQEALEKLVGTYDIEDVLVIDIFVHEGQLMLQGEGQGAIPLTPTGDVTFENKAVGIAIEFDDAEAPTQFLLFQAGMTFVAERISE